MEFYLRNPTPVVDSPTSIVVLLATLSRDTTPNPLVDPWANQLEEEGPSPALTTMLIKFCACHYHEPDTRDRVLFFFLPFCLLVEGTE